MMVTLRDSNPCFFHGWHIPRWNDMPDAPAEAFVVEYPTDEVAQTAEAQSVVCGVQGAGASDNSK